MAEHWNIQIKIQQVTTTGVDAKQARGINQVISGQDRQVTDVMSLAIVADTEVEAYEKAQRMLTANHPDVQVIHAGETVPPYNLPLKRPIRDNPQA